MSVLTKGDRAVARGLKAAERAWARAQRAKVRAARPALRALAAVDKVLAAGGPTSAALWALLTALRGPDTKELDEPAGLSYSDGTARKLAFTIPLRARVFPQTAQEAKVRGQFRHLGSGWAQPSGFHAAFDTKNRVPVRRWTGSHFEEHAGQAIEALHTLGIITREEGQ